ncbi:FGGY-family carbohydrate kinase [Pseudoduganella sp. UC29_106]|uniref:FGGY-family carbohydrate kinase n=1 Tax=Pseudoduganella sp. UC29_106 TaxID=3374553 RepID=UPI003756825F
MIQDRRATVVLDIGKTNAKLTLISPDGVTLAEQRRPNIILHDAPYPHHDTEGIWSWMLDTLRAYAAQAPIGAIVPVTHGATAALIDDDGLVLPVLDYEFELPADHVERYGRLRPAYVNSHSPRLPAGLNLGSQLVWQAMAFPAEFAKARHILMYPQYWAWRLCGVAASEVTSLGCHTDLWQPARQRYSALVERMGWYKLFPALQPAWQPLGTLKGALAAQTGLPADCQVLCGIHDSNASLLRHLGGTEAPAVLSTGTWVIAAAPGKPLDSLREEADMLANCSAFGEPVACMRFMGGREFGAIAGDASVACSEADLAKIVLQGTFAVPAFAAAGPFARHAGGLVGPEPADAAERYALATLYEALMCDYCLSALGVDGAVVVEGAFTGNPHFARLLAALRAPGGSVGGVGRGAVMATDDTSGTTCGGWLLHRRDGNPQLQGHVAQPLQLAGLEGYRQRWLELTAG